MARATVVRRPRRARAEGTIDRTRRATVETALVPLGDPVLVSAVEFRTVRGRRLTRVVRITGGWVVFGIGVVFVILPIIPGTPLVILAAFMLAPDVPMFARVLDWSKSRFSHVTTGISDVHQRFAEDFHRRFRS